MPATPIRTLRACIILALTTAGLLTAAVGCPGPVDTTEDDGAGPCGFGFLGDPTKDIELTAVQLNAAGEMVEVSDGGSVDLILPPQGGRVVFVGARATNIDPCEVQVQGVLKDTDSGQVRFDTRVVNLTVAGEMGSSNAFDIASFSNIPLCPNQWSARDAFGVPYELSLKLTDRAGRSGEVTMSVTPTCAEPQFEAECLCTCKQGYVLGQTCD